MAARPSPRLLLLAALLLAVPARGEEPTLEERVQARLAPGLSGDEVRGVVREALSSDPSTLAAMARRLGALRGPAAAAGLAVLLRYPEEEVRLACLQSAAAVRLRCEDLRAALTDRLQAARLGPAERLAVLEALGWTGDGRDVPFLLDLAASPDADVERAAHVALRTLAGLPADARTDVRRRAWWATVSGRGARDLERAMDGLEADAEGLDRDLHRLVLRLRGWLDLPATSERLTAWLRGSDIHLQVEAARAVGALRMADLEPVLRPVLRYGQGAARVAAREALRDLGVALEPQGPAAGG